MDYTTNSNHEDIINFGPLAEEISSQPNMIHTPEKKLQDAFIKGLASTVVIPDNGVPVAISYARIIDLTSTLPDEILGDDLVEVGELGTVYTSPKYRHTNVTNQNISHLFEVMDRLRTKNNIGIVIGTLTSIQMAKKLALGIDKGYKVILCHHHANLKKGIRGNPFSHLTCVCNENIGPVGGRGSQFGDDACPIRTHLSKDIVIPIQDLEHAIQNGLLTVKADGSFGECYMFVIHKDDPQGNSDFENFVNSTKSERRAIATQAGLSDYETLRQDLIENGYYEG